jgi:hypothetical protein
MASSERHNKLQEEEEEDDSARVVFDHTKSWLET